MKEPILSRAMNKPAQATAEKLRRITGISLPFGGLQWTDPGPSEAEIVRGFLVFLEDRRVLYNSMQLEETSQVERSIHDIRKECTRMLQALAPKAFAAIAVRSIRAAGRRFHDDQQEEFQFFDGHEHCRGGTPGFFVALGSFRATVGHQVAALAARYNVDVEGDLVSLLPRLDEGEQP